MDSRCHAGHFRENGHSGLMCYKRPDWARRKPKLLFRFDGVFLLRLAERTLAGLLFQEPPRFTRWVRQAGARVGMVHQQTTFGEGLRFRHGGRGQSSFARADRCRSNYNENAGRLVTAV